MRAQTFESDTVSRYLEVLIAYHGCDLKRLEELVSISKSHCHASKEDQILHLCAALRLQIRKHEIQRSLIDDLVEASIHHPLWRGEALLVAGYACDLLGDDKSCRDFNLAAHRALEQSGLKRKAILALANYVAAESRIHPERHCIADLLYIVRRARQVKNVTTAATAMTHLSREYQRLGAWDAALKYAARAVATAGKNGGNLAYYYALAQKVHVLAQLGCHREARLGFQLASTAQFPVIQSALKVLAEQFPEIALLPEEDRIHAGTALRNAVIPFWQDRQENKPFVHLSKLEQKLVTYLSDAPRSKTELSVYLYGDKISRESAEGRLFTLLGRIKKKHPGLIHWAVGMYRLKESAIVAPEVRVG